MATKSTFTHTIKWVENEFGDAVLLPNESDLVRLEAQVAELISEAEAKAAQLKSLTEQAEAAAKSEDDQDKTKAAGAIGFAAASYAGLVGRLNGMRDFVERARAIVDHYGKDASKWEFTLHRWSYLERELTQNDCRVPSSDGVTTTVDQGRFSLAILVVCLDKWSLKRKEITQESIAEELPPQAIDRLSAILRARSEASIDSLPFPGAVAAGLVAAQPGQAG